MKCRSCNSTNLTLIISFGDMPLANGLLDSPDDECVRYPLDLYLCYDCTLVQISQTIPPEILFEKYVYYSSYSNIVLANAEKLVGRVMERYNPEFVVEIASNDGYLLQYYPDSVDHIIGIEPAENVAVVAMAKGITTRTEYFSAELARTFGKKPDIIHANNVLAHVADLNDFVEGISVLLSDDGVAIIEVPYVTDMIENCEFDTIYHEHLCYFSVTALEKLFSRHGLFIRGCEFIPVHGGSLRLFLKKQEDTENYLLVLTYEDVLGVDKFSYYQDFAKEVECVKRNLSTYILQLQSEGNVVAGIGAAAKATMLLNHCNIHLDYVVDNIPAKHGRFIPGVGTPIYTMGCLDEPDYLVVLPWNHADEIMGKLSDYKGKFIIPIPELRVV